jgi:hypothetical protein
MDGYHVEELPVDKDDWRWCLMYYNIAVCLTISKETAELIMLAMEKEIPQLY